MSEQPQQKPLGVYEAINRVQAAIAAEGISKNRQNEQQHYAFRGVDDVYNALSSILAENHLCIIPNYTARTCEERQTQRGGTIFYVTVEGEYDIVCSTDGSRHTARLYGEAMDSGDKATNKAMSAAYKYLCLQLFCIPTKGDNDADATTHEVAPRAQPTRNNHLTTVKGGADPANDKAAVDEMMQKLPADQRKYWLSHCVTQFGKQYKELAGKEFTELLNDMNSTSVAA